jgi:hypothetical protein
MLAFVGGWGWTGLWLLAMSRANPISPAAAIGTVYVGAMAGSVLGPFAFGMLADYVSYSAAWLLMASMALIGAVAVLLSRRRILSARLQQGTS